MESVLHKVVDFCGLSVTDEVIKKTLLKSSFEYMQQDKNTNYSWDRPLRRESSEPFLRKGKIGDWRNHFSDSQNGEFDKLYEEMMTDTGLDFEF